MAIYFKVFRFRKNELAGMPLKTLLSKEMTGSAILIFLLILTAANFLPNQGIKTANAKLSKTTASALILSDFDTNIEEILVEELLTPAILADAKQKPSQEESVVDKDELFETELDENKKSSLLIISDSGDLVLKPKNFSAPEINNTDTQARTEIVDYVVQLGDTVSSIANRFGVSVNTVLWANNLGNYSLIRPGDTLSILPFSGLLYSVKSGDNLSKIANTYKIESEEIALHNNISVDSSLKIGQKLILPGATKITTSAPRTTTSSSYTGVSVIKDLVKAPAAQADGDNMVWPAEGKRITQYFSWAHNGLDIANKTGTAIYAAEAGTVEISASGWNGGYGNTILINHGDGKKTRYGHLSVLYVKVGDSVEKGENIGAMGSTGRSTGPHLHFEVVINGTRYNPLNYIK
ncbi:M23 family metallopeptidase [Patescibacteria group bacterium]|nr:M23 family metallopeptidase [Patescibacteria group bacterium]